MTSPDAKAESPTPPGPSELERAQDEYLSELRAHRQPSVARYIQRLPHHEHELLAFAFYAETIAADLPDFDAVPDPQLAQPAHDVLARIAQSFAPPDAEASAARAGAPSRRAKSGGVRTLTSLAEAGRAMNTPPAALAEHVGLTTDILTLLDQRAIDPQTIPPLLIARLAGALGVRQHVVASYLRAPSARRVAEVPAAYAARSQSEPPRISFVEAVRASALLHDDYKREWTSLGDGEALGPGEP